MPIVGDIPMCNTLRPRVKPASATTQEWMDSMSGRNKQAVGRVERFRHTVLGNECWQKSLREVEDGWTSPPKERTAGIAESLNLTPRFAIFEQHGNGPRKVRIIDDMGTSGVNSITATNDTAVPDSLDLFLAASYYYRLIRPGRDMLGKSSDFFHAYKAL